MSEDGRINIAASRIGVTPDEYRCRCAEGYKWCYKCRDWQPVTEFYHSNNHYDGLYPYCKLTHHRKRRELKSKPTDGKATKLKGVTLTDAELAQVERIMEGKEQMSHSELPSARLEAIEAVVIDRRIGEMVCHGGTEMRL